MNTIQDPMLALADTASRINAEPYNPHWFFMFSGGKDSNATVQSALYLVAKQLVQAPLKVVILFADTQMEFPQYLEEVSRKGELLAEAWRALGVEARYIEVAPIIQSDFWVRLLGWGYAPPTKPMRWCTDHLKIQPARKMRNALGMNDALLFVGARYGESGRRDDFLSCTIGGECGPDAMARVKSKFPTLLPIVHWRQCAVWDFLQLIAPTELNISNKRLRDIYGPDGDLRYGCWSCPLIFNDRTAAHWAQTDPQIAELLRWTNQNLRPGGAAWDSKNREMFERQEARLSLDYCKRLYAELIDMSNRHSRALLKEWQIASIQSIWLWRQQVPQDMQGTVMQTPLFDLNPKVSAMQMAAYPARSAQSLATAPLESDTYHQVIQNHAKLLLDFAPTTIWHYLTQVGTGLGATTYWEGNDRRVSVKGHDIHV